MPPFSFKKCLGSTVGGREIAKRLKRYLVGRVRNYWLGKKSLFGLEIP